MSAVSTRPLRLETQTTPTEVRVHCHGRIVIDTCKLLQATVQPLIPTTKVLLIYLDHVQFVDSAGLGAIVSLHVAAKRAGCELKLMNPSLRVKELLKITSLTDLLENREGRSGDPSQGTP